jgi:hypothetical protein
METDKKTNLTEQERETYLLRFDVTDLLTVEAILKVWALSSNDPINWVYSLQKIIEELTEDWSWIKE